MVIDEKQYHRQRSGRLNRYELQIVVMILKCSVPELEIDGGVKREKNLSGVIGDLSFRHLGSAAAKYLACFK